MTISTEANPHLPEKVRPYWTANGKALDRFNKFCKADSRIDSILLPVYDGLTLIKWKDVGSATNGSNGSNGHNGHNGHNGD